MYGSTESVQELKQIYMETRQEEEREVQQRKKEQKKEKKGGDVNVVKKKAIRMGIVTVVMIVLGAAAAVWYKMYRWPEYSIKAWNSACSPFQERDTQTCSGRWKLLCLWSHLPERRKLEIVNFSDKFDQLKKADKAVKSPKYLQEVMGIGRIAENGSFWSRKGIYSRTYRFLDINYVTAGAEEQMRILKQYCKTVNAIDIYFLITSF